MLQLIYYKKLKSSLLQMCTLDCSSCLQQRRGHTLLPCTKKCRTSERQWVKYWLRRHCWHRKSTLLPSLHNIIVIFTMVALEIWGLLAGYWAVTVASGSQSSITGTHKLVTGSCIAIFVCAKLSVYSHFSVLLIIQGTECIVVFNTLV